jgi:hypothetical protein
MRERLLAVLHGGEHDRVPFVTYEGCAAPNEEVWSAVGRDRVGVLRWSGVHRLEHPHCRFLSEGFEREGRKGQRTTLITPEGQLTEERIFEPAYGSSSVRSHYVREPEDYRVLAAYLGDTVVCDDTERVQRDARELGDAGGSSGILPGPGRYGALAGPVLDVRGGFGCQCAAGAVVRRVRRCGDQEGQRLPHQTHRTAPRIGDDRAQTRMQCSLRRTIWRRERCNERVVIPMPTHHRKQQAARPAALLL